MKMNITDKYTELNLEAICVAYDRYRNLYDGDWVQMGNYPEDGCSVPTEGGRKKAIQLLKGLYQMLKPYEQSIKADWESIRENKTLLWWDEQVQIQVMYDACKDYHDKVEFMDMIAELQHENKNNAIGLPEELSTDIAEKIFGIAISKGWIGRETNGLTWKGFGEKPCVAQLAYLCGRVYGYMHKNDRNEGEHIPYKALERLFSVERLDRSLKQVHEAKSPQRWRKDIDNLFD